MNAALVLLIVGVAATYGQETNTTTAAPPPTPGPPAPKPNATVVSFNVTEGKVVCIMLDLEADFAVPYTRTDNKTDTAHIVIPKSANATGSCGDSENDINISWSEENNANATRKLSIIFTSDGKTYKVSKIALYFVIDATTFPDDSAAGDVSVQTSKPDIQATELAYAYQCKSKQSITLSSSDNATKVTVELSHVKLQAFNTADDFGDPELCEADASGTSDIVPIAVGCALAALVVIVIVAYLIGRRRAKSRGYQSM